MSFSHFYFWKAPFSGSSIFLFIHVVGQSFLETGLLLFVALVINRIAPRWVLSMFIGFTFMALSVQYVNFEFIRFSDTCMSYNAKYIIGCGLTHLVENLIGGYVGIKELVLFGSVIVLCPFIGIFFYRLTYPLSKRISPTITLSRLVFGLAGTSASLFALDLLFLPSVDRLTMVKYQKILPFEATIVPQSPNLIQLSKPIAERNENQIDLAVKEKKWTAEKKPNIYLVVIESLRKDFITKEIAPNLFAFGKENFSFKESFSNANATDVSYLSIFHSDYPYHWASMWKNWQGGSVPLRILKDLGYKTNVYTSSILKTFSMDSFLFGKNLNLINKIDDFSLNLKAQAWERDEECFRALRRDLEKEGGQEGNLFILFLDSTHASYSFSEKEPLPFLPISSAHLFSLDANNLEPMKNRYRNAIHHIDSLFGKLFETLKEKNLYNDAIIAITADHGEEFMEEGALWHASHLNTYQTSIPIFYKIQDNAWKPLDDCTTQVDIFPTIIHYLTKRSDFDNFFDGRSIFEPNRHSSRVAVMDNRYFPPREFTVSKKNETYRFRFPNPNNIYKSRSIEVLGKKPSDQDLDDLLFPLTK